jgi:hypothetical protein
MGCGHRAIGLGGGGREATGLSRENFREGAFVWQSKAGTGAGGRSVGVMVFGERVGASGFVENGGWGWVGGYV